MLVVVLLSVGTCAGRAVVVLVEVRRDWRGWGRDEIAWDWIGWGWIGWDGIGWDGIGWDGMGLDGLGWDGVCELTRALTFRHSPAHRGLAQNKALVQPSDSAHGEPGFPTHQCLFAFSLGTSVSPH